MTSPEPSPSAKIIKLGPISFLSGSAVGKGFIGAYYSIDEGRLSLRASGLVASVPSERVCSSQFISRSTGKNHPLTISLKSGKNYSLLVMRNQKGTRFEALFIQINPHKRDEDEYKDFYSGEDSSTV